MLALCFMLFKPSIIKILIILALYFMFFIASIIKIHTNNSSSVVYFIQRILDCQKLPLICNEMPNLRAYHHEYCVQRHCVGCKLPIKGTLHNENEILSLAEFHPLSGSNSQLMALDLNDGKYLLIYGSS